MAIHDPDFLFNRDAWEFYGSLFPLSTYSGTEIIIESTASGSNAFFELWNKSIAHKKFWLKARRVKRPRFN